MISRIKKVGLSFGVILICCCLALPSSALAWSLPLMGFGGTVGPMIPCIGGWYVVLVPPGPPLSYGPYIIYYATPFRASPLTHPGQRILGKTLTPLVCFIPGIPPIPLVGQGVLYYGASVL